MAPKCSICTHPDRAKIDKAILAGESNRRIATQYCDIKNGQIPNRISKTLENNEFAQPTHS